MDETKVIIRESEMRHITAKPGAKCGWCKKPLPQAVMNPQWPWKSPQGRGISVFCCGNCMDWGVYTNKRRGLQTTFARKHMSEEEIEKAIARWDENMKSNLMYPTEPMPEMYKAPDVMEADGQGDEPETEEEAMEANDEIKPAEAVENVKPEAAEKPEGKHRVRKMTTYAGDVISGSWDPELGTMMGVRIMRSEMGNIDRKDLEILRDELTEILDDLGGTQA